MVIYRRPSYLCICHPFSRSTPLPSPSVPLVTHSYTLQGSREDPSPICPCCSISLCTYHIVLKLSINSAVISDQWGGRSCVLSFSNPRTWPRHTPDAQYLIDEWIYEWIFSFRKGGTMWRYYNQAKTGVLRQLTLYINFCLYIREGQNQYLLKPCCVPSYYACYLRHFEVIILSAIIEMKKFNKTK